MSIDTHKLARIASAISHVDACNEGLFENCPPGYTVMTLEYQVDVRLVCDTAKAVLKRMSSSDERAERSRALDLIPRPTPVEQESLVNIATALSRLQAWDEGETAELPEGYTDLSINHAIDRRVVREFAAGVLALLAEKF